MTAMKEIKIITTQAQHAATIREKVRMEDISLAMGRVYGERSEFIMRKKLQVVGPPFTYYHSWSDDCIDLECGFPVSGPIEGDSRIKPFALPSVRAAMATHVGPYHRLGETYAIVEKFIRSSNLVPAPYMWEKYLNEPGKVPDEQLLTEIYWPIEEQ